MIVIIDYGLGNLKSIQNMLSKIGVASLISSQIEEIKNAEKLILPGVGAFDFGVVNLESKELKSTILNKVLSDKTPILGICLGMQLLFENSEEGKLPGLGLISGKVVKFKTEFTQIKIPHMGWNNLNIKKESKLFPNTNEELRFYFVHSYYVQCVNNSDVTATSNHGYEFTCALEHENIFGVQFHPEKSHKFGMNLLQRFASL